jgi:hypothetical protein
VGLIVNAKHRTLNAGEEKSYPYYTRLGRPLGLEWTDEENLTLIEIRSPDTPARGASTLTQDLYTVCCWTLCAVWRIFIMLTFNIALGPTQPPIQYVPSISRGRKRPERDSDPSRPSKNRVELYHYSP